MNPDKPATAIPITNAKTVKVSRQKEQDRLCIQTFPEVTALYRKEEGNEFFQKGNFEEALKLYSESIDLFPDSNVYNNRAMCHMKMKNYTSAMEDLNKVLQADCRNVKALYRRAMCRKEINNFQEELDDLFAILKIEPRNSIVKHELLIAKENLSSKNGKNESKEKSTTKSSYFEELYRGDIQACSSLMRNISFKNFQETIRDHDFSKEALTTIIEALCRKFDIETEWHLVYKYLVDIASLNCFDILCKSIKSDSKFVLKQMLRRAASLSLDDCYKIAKIYKPMIE